MAQPKKPASKKKTGSRRGGSDAKAAKARRAKKAEEPEEEPAVDPFAPTQRAPAPAPEKAPLPFGAAPPAFGADKQKKGEEEAVPQSQQR